METLDQHLTKLETHLLQAEDTAPAPAPAPEPESEKKDAMEEFKIAMDHMSPENMKEAMKALSEKMESVDETEDTEMNKVVAAVYKKMKSDQAENKTASAPPQVNLPFNLQNTTKPENNIMSEVLGY